ncbi:CBS domain-containing protein [Streptomyces sp. NPDC087420]|uniref:CBS domain-containing protein n=1 Tax=Streptomyces sp. NPDC087420 TaxID=3365785 RepID=UPI003839604C
MTPIRIARAQEPTAADVMTPADLQVSDHTTVDKTLSILHSAHADHLLVRGEDGRCTGLVTPADLDLYRTQPWYTQQTRLRDLPPAGSPFAGADMPASTVATTMRAHGVTAWPVIDPEGFALGIITTE